MTETPLDTSNSAPGNVSATNSRSALSSLAGVDEIAKDVFGIAALHPLQRVAISNILGAFGPEELPARKSDGEFNLPGGESYTARQMVILPTGAGKSACFQIPAAMGLKTVVVFPLLGLIEDQRRRLDNAGIECVVLKGGMEREEKATAFGRFESGDARIVLTNPETLLSGDTGQKLGGIGVDHLAIDEAHCVPEWGETFRPSYSRVGEIVSILKPRAVSGFTATASPETLAKSAASLFGNAGYELVSGSPDRPNIRYSVVKTLDRRSSLCEALDTCPKPCIVFVSSRGRSMSESLAARDRYGEIVRFYHAGLSREERTDIEKWFFDSADGILFATCAYGMGIDKRNIRTVIHYDAPGSAESYLQESGRAGRDGLASDAILLADPSTCTEKNPDARKRRFLSSILDDSACRRSSLLALLGVDRKTVECSGCDVCDGCADPSFRGSDAVMRLARTHPRRFCISGAANELSSAGFGWDSDGWKRAINMAESEGLVTVRKRGFWKDRIEPRPALRKKVI